jgi:NADPH:quinone reductase-like Zn-dependent oxidoreductase
VLTYEDAPQPVPKSHELLVRVKAAGVNPVDWKTRAGRGIAGRLINPFPLILGWDISGVVEAIGAAVVDFAVGDEVYGMPRFPDVAAAYAEYVTVPFTEVARKPVSIDHTHAAALPLVSLTAWQALFDAGKLAAGQRVLIHAAAGGVGHIAVQLAKWKGAYVFGTASARNEAFLRELGVNEFINYQTTQFGNIATEVDLVLDSMSGETRNRSWQTLKKGGVLVSILGPASAETAAEYGVRIEKVLVQPNQAQLVDAGHIKAVIDAVIPLKDASIAHQRIEEGHTRGKIVLEAAS